MYHKLALYGGDKVIAEPLPTFRDRSGRSLGQEEMEVLREVVDSGSLAYICGSKVSEFERAYADLLGVRHAVSTSSGTAAIHTALIYLNPEPGDEVIVSPITDIGGVTPIVSQLAVPVFVDIDPADQNIDPTKIEAAITSRTRAIIVTHIYGAPADMDAIMAIADKHDLFVIEDCAQAHLARYKNRLVGTIGHLGCFSFQQSKHMTTGDGGMVISNEDERFGRKLRHCMDKGWPREQGGRDHLFLAPNYHMTELQAAVGLAQLKKLPTAIQLRRRSAATLAGRMDEIHGVRTLDTSPDDFETWFCFVFIIDQEHLSVTGAEFAEALAAEGVDCFCGYPGKVPIYKYPVIKDHHTFGNSRWPFSLSDSGANQDYGAELCPLAEQACRGSIVIWWNENLTTHHADLIGDAVAKVVDYYSDNEKNNSASPLPANAL